MSEFTKNEIEWKKIFQHYNILEEISLNGFYVIDSKQINRYREARLMTKFDTSNQLPEIFQKNKLSILPTSRGGYVISHFDAYKKIESLTNEITFIEFPTYLESIELGRITSESTAINCAYVSGILSDFLEDYQLVPTVSGRMNSSIFEFKIYNNIEKNDVIIGVSKSQIEIDGGYEGEYVLALLEAKNSIDDDFLVRQLYYPFRLWNSRISKPVIPVFMTYSNSIFNLYQYEFNDINHYNSLSLVKHKKYSFEQTNISIEDILYIRNRIKIILEPKIPFPQADKFEKIINLCELLYNENASLTDIASEYSFDIRQSQYYSTAGKYLGLIQNINLRGANIISLTPYAKKILNLPYRSRQLKLVESILSHKVFYEVFNLALSNHGEISNSRQVIEIMKRCDLYAISSDSTYHRRSYTVIKWIDWIFNLCNT